MALAFWRQVDLPVPDPVIVPGLAITGNTAYLEVGSEVNASFSSPVPGFGTLVVEAVGQTTVDWGDGTVEAYGGSVGGPYPDGDVAHVYGEAGVVDVVVVQDWTAEWSLGAASGTLGGLQTQGVIEDFEVRQIQAVLG